MSRRILFFFTILVALADLRAQPSPTPQIQPEIPAPQSSPPPLTEVLFKGLKARAIGPAVMGGRISDIAIDPRNPGVFYVGTATGGVFKTNDNGATFDPIFDKESALSIGAIAIAPSDPDVIYVGTGEANDRNSSGWGNGVYRSNDGGSTWENVGLKDTRTIGRIVVHPKDPNIAYVAASGHLWVDGGERGLFKTTDGGKNWKPILQAQGRAAARTGCSDVAFDPSNPEIIFATLYARQRTPWNFTYGAAATDGEDVGGIFKSTNGGAAWKKLTNGLPTQTGRIGLSVSASNPKIVMAVVQSEEGGPSDIRDITSKRGGVFRSEDSGEKWTRTSDVCPRPFYFSQIRVDPVNDQRVYVLGFALLVSDDGGKTFREDLTDKIHPDCHALAIQANSAPPPKAAKPDDKKPPKPPVCQRLVLGNDGGVYQSYAAGKGWDHLANIPCGQFYRISLDDSQPFYRIAGGLQDNCNFVGPSGVQNKDGIVNNDWTNLGGGDGFYVLFDPTDRDILYAESQEGSMHRMNMRTGEIRQLRPAPAEGQPAYRFHWNAPMVLSKHNSGVLYLAGNRVFRLTNRGEESTPISPDLTRNEPEKTTATGSGAENYGVIFSLAESPVKAGLLWAGTDDGRLWVTENDGAKWSELTQNLPEPFRNQWVVRIEPSHQDPKVAYVAFNAYRTGDDRPMIARTNDGGATWQSIVGEGIPAYAPIEVIREDPGNARLLYVGTHFGLFATFDGGAKWMRLGDLPAVRVDDLQIHPRTSDLVIATHGRSLAIIDDTRPLRDLTPEAAAQSAHLFPIAPVNGAYQLPGWVEWAGKAEFRGKNPPEGAVFTVWVKEYTGDEMKIAITNANGSPVANLKSTPGPGLTRLNWDLLPTKDVLTQYGGIDAKRLVPSGDYTAELTFGKTKEKQTFKVNIAEGIRTR
ncbi:MAG: glycosyl hydrolase [Verrucomicrobiota bacterium]|nr:glycosyl hydrolase [Verrucomicrobiota bacterium]